MLAKFYILIFKRGIKYYYKLKSKNATSMIESIIDHHLIVILKSKP